MPIQSYDSLRQIVKLSKLEVPDEVDYIFLLILISFVESKSVDSILTLN